MCEHEVGLTVHELGPSSVDVPLVGLELGGQGYDVVIELSIASDLPCQPPVVHLSHGGL
jgi:hypothetical protein